MFDWTSPELDGGGDGTRGLLRALADRRRRAVLSTLLDSTAPLGVDELATRVRERTDVDGEQLALALHHQHLPVLSAAGLVRDSDRGVAIPEAREPVVETALEWVDGVATERGEVGSLLSDPLARATVLELGDRSPEGCVDLECLAGAVADRTDADLGPETVAIELHHVHLPKLDDAGVLEFDPGSGRVEFGDQVISSAAKHSSLAKRLADGNHSEVPSRRDPPA